MAKLAGNERQGWRARLERSDWVDTTSWLPGDDEAQTAGIEFLGAEPSAYRLSSAEAVEREPAATASWARVAGLGAVFVVLVAVAIMSRPGEQDPFDQLPADQQQAILQRRVRESGQTVPALTTAPTPAAAEASAPEADDSDGAAEVEAARQELPPIAPLRPDLPEDLPGVVFGYGVDGSVIRIQRSLDAPAETPLELTRSDRERATALAVGADFVVVGGGRLHHFDAGGAEELRSFEGGQLLPADGGQLVVVQRRSPAQTAELVSLRASAEEPEPVPTWSLFADVDVLGAWRDHLLVTKVGAVWSLDLDNRPHPIAEGHVLDYDGRHLSTLRCTEPSACRIQVGTPDQPTRRAIPVPEQLNRLPLEAWSSSVAVSPDGRRLAFSLDLGTVALPVWVDLETGEEHGLPDRMNHSSPLAWSPDGTWLAYAFLDDITLWSTETERSFRIVVDRQTNYLAWSDTPDAAEAG